MPVRKPMGSKVAQMAASKTCLIKWDQESWPTNAHIRPIYPSIVIIIGGMRKDQIRTEIIHHKNVSNKEASIVD